MIDCIAKTWLVSCESSGNFFFENVLLMWSHRFVINKTKQKNIAKCTAIFNLYIMPTRVEWFWRGKHEGFSPAL